MDNEKPMTGEELGLELLEAVRQMKARKFGRVTAVETPNALTAGLRAAPQFASPELPCQPGEQRGGE